MLADVQDQEDGVLHCWRTIPEGIKCCCKCVAKDVSKKSLLAHAEALYQNER